ncbi:uncharacterized protein LOC136036944 isoform X2 [Artemia franciscana]
MLHIPLFITILQGCSSGSIPKRHLNFEGLSLGSLKSLESSSYIDYKNVSSSSLVGRATLSDNGNNVNTTGALDGRRRKFLSIFSIVRFSNDMCNASGGFYNGTCLTQAECTTAGGIASGYCASGFGVCCVLTISTCGRMTNRNCTYFQNPGYPNSVDGPLQCSLQVKKCSSNICQLRLDFHAFGIAQPEVQSATNANLATQCTTDAFTVTGVSNNVPVICGLNTNQHIYLDMTTNTDMFTLSFALGSVTGPPGQTFETSNQRYWNIKVSQIPCDGTIRAPDGCLQYYTAASGRLTSFNFDIVTPDNSRHLANQDYGICIRMAQGYCGICYTVCDSVDNAFSVSLGYNPNSGSYTTSTNGALPSVCTTDYVTILGAFIPQTGTQGNQAAQYADRICGTAFSTANTNGAANAPATVCSNSKPFELRFRSDSGEVSSIGTIPQETGIHGFCLDYSQQACTTSSG